MIFSKRFTKILIGLLIFLLISYFIYIYLDIDNLLKIEQFNRPSIKNINRIKEIREKLKVTNKDKWIVVTTINKPTEQIKKLSSINGFQLVVVGDLKTDDSWSYDNTVFLSVDTQEGVGFKSYDTTPFNSYNRKNIGYLFAILNGARFIYDTDDDNAPTIDLNTYFNFNKYDHGLIFDKESPNVLNPYSHFGQPTIWPRGHPLSAIQNSNYNSYICGKRKVSYVQQGVVNGDPDVDAIFRLTKSMNYKRINITFDETSPSIQYPIYKLSPYNSQNTFFHYEALWSLYLPNTVSFRLTDIWRSYWSQRLLWLLNGTVSFYGPNAFQLRNSHSYLKDFEQEQAMYLKTEKLIKFLYTWRCTKKMFYECVIDLSYNMAKENFWEHAEVDSIKNWLDDLNSIGYMEPRIVNYEYETSFSMDRFYLNENNDPSYFPVRYTPKFQKGLDFDNYAEGEIIETFDNYKSIKYLEAYCAKNNYELRYNTASFEINTYNKPNIILIVTFNFDPIEENVELIKHVYGSYFKNIIFCGGNITQILKSARNENYKKFDSYTFIDAELNSGFQHYFCMARAYEMSFNVDGFLLMSDDVLLKYWEFKNLDIRKTWYFEPIVCDRDLDLNANLENCHVKHKHMCTIAAYNAFGYLESIKNGTINVDKEEMEMIDNFLETLDKHAKSKSSFRKFCFQAADIFYLPKSKLKAFHYFSRLFVKYNVVLELAVPTILAALDTENSYEIITGLYYWNGKQFDFALYNQMKYFAHPSKISHYKNPGIGSQYCSLFVQDKIKNDYLLK